MFCVGANVRDLSHECCSRLFIFKTDTMSVFLDGCVATRSRDLSCLVRVMILMCESKFSQATAFVENSFYRFHNVKFD